jgi:hypothetical protein
MLSPDGMFFWDGAAWRPAVSPDGLWRYDGQSWVPSGFLPPRPAKPVREPTRWTRPLQAAVIGWQVLGLVIGLALTVFVLPSFFAQAIAQQPAAPATTPAGGEGQAQALQAVAVLVPVFLVFGLAVGGAIALVVAIGVLKRWTWLFWTLAVLYLLGALGAIQNGVQLVAPSPAGLQLPAWYYLYGLCSGLVQAGLAAAMLVAGIRIGPWACRRVA